MQRIRYDINDVKQTLKLYYEEGITIRKAALATGIPRSTVSDYVKRIEASGLSPEEALELSLSNLKEKLVPEKTKIPSRVLPDPAYVAEEIKRPGVTYLLLWQEYIENNPSGYSSTQFKYYMNDFRKKLEPSCRNHYRGGEVIFADFRKGNIFTGIT
ncbi:MAG: helix-turn-helix domain-containing protein [bacterium]